MCSERKMLFCFFLSFFFLKNISFVIFSTVFSFYSLFDYLLSLHRIFILNISDFPFLLFEHEVFYGTHIRPNGHTVVLSFFLYG
jgi:hypothetical protein